MKIKSIFNILIFFLTVNNIYGNNICEIKQDLLEFLIRYENCKFTSIEDIANSSIIEIRKLKPINKNINGVFLFNSINFHVGYAHFLLVENDSYEIINMRESFNDNIKKIICFLERNSEYNEDDTIFYISTFIRIYNENKKPDGIITTKRQ
jgi:hypothetical protein